MIKIFQEDDTKKLTLSYNNLFNNDPLRTITLQTFLYLHARFICPWVFVTDIMSKKKLCTWLFLIIFTKEQFLDSGETSKSVTKNSVSFWCQNFPGLSICVLVHRSPVIFLFARLISSEWLYQLTSSFLSISTICSPFNSQDQFVNSPLWLYTFPCKWDTRIWCQIKVTTLTW